MGTYPHVPAERPISTEDAALLLAVLHALTFEVLWITDQGDNGRLDAIERLHKDGRVIETARALLARLEG